MSRSLLFTLAVAVVVGCGARPQPAADAAPSLAGVTLKLLVVGDEKLAAAMRLLHGQWQAETGGELAVAVLTYEELDEQSAAGKLPGDAILYAPRHLGLLAERGVLRPFSTHWLADPALDWGGVFELVKTREVTWGDKVYAVPLGTPVLVCFYREDLLEKVGKKPPRTWQEYQQLIAALAELTGKADVAATDESTAAAAPPAVQYATIEPLGEGWAGLTLLARAAAYARHPNHYSALFNMETMEPLLATPPFQRALEELVAAAKLAPAAALERGPADTWNELAAGRVAMALCWPAAGGEGGQSQQVELDLNCVELPGDAECYNATVGQWQRRPGGIASVPLLGMAGRVGSVAADCAHPDAALRLLAWLSGAGGSNQASAARDPLAPARSTQMRAAMSGAGVDLPAGVAPQYAAAVAASLTQLECLVAPRIPGAERYMAALDDCVRQAAADAATPEAALADAADRWRTITAELGLAEQRKAYRRSLGLEP